MTEGGSNGESSGESNGESKGTGARARELHSGPSHAQARVGFVTCRVRNCTTLTTTARVCTLLTKCRTSQLALARRMHMVFLTRGTSLVVPVLVSAWCHGLCVRVSAVGAWMWQNWHWLFAAMDGAAVVLSYSFRYDMSDEEAIELGKRAIYHATHRDAYSGGTNNGTHGGKSQVAWAIPVCFHVVSRSTGEMRRAAALGWL